MKKIFLISLLTFITSLLNGATWEKVCASSPFDGKQIFAMSRVTDGKLYLCTWANTAGVFRLDLDGTANPPYAALWAKKDFMDLKVSPFDPGILHGVNWDGLYYKMSGVTGTSVSNTSAQLNTVVTAACSVEPDRTNALRILAGTYDGLYRSDDGGATFSQINPQGFVQLEQSPWDADIFYAVCINWNNGVSFGGVYKYEMSSNTLTLLGLSGVRTRSMAIDTNNAGCFYVVADNGQAYYYNGTSFITKGKYPGEVSTGRECAFAYYGGKEYLFACGEAARVYVSADGASTWHYYSTGLTAGGLMLKYDASSGYMYHGSNGAGLWRLNLALMEELPTATSTRTPTPSFTFTFTPTATPTVMQMIGGTWEKVCASSPFDGKQIFAMSRVTDGKLYLCTWANTAGVFRLDLDGTANPPYTALWAKKDFMDLKVSPFDPGILHGVNWDGLYYKMSGVTGTSVSNTSAQLNTVVTAACSVEPDRTNALRILAGTYDGLYRSDDGGATFSQINPQGFVQLEQSPWDADIFYAVCINWNNGVSFGGVYKYEMSSNTLTLLGLSGVRTRTMAIDTNNTGCFYVVADNGQAYYYNGTSFQTRGQYPGEVSTGRECAFAYYGGKEYLFACGEAAKVYVSTDGASTWQRISDGLTAGGLMLKYDASSGYMYHGSNGAGLWRLNLADLDTSVTATLTPVPTFTKTFTPVATNTTAVTAIATPTVTSTPAAVFTVTPLPTATIAVTVTDNDTEVYPSVGKDEVKIVFNTNKKADIKIYVYAVDGRLVDTVDYTTGWTPNDKLYQIKLDTSKYPNGVYFYTIQGKDDTGKIINFKSKKFIIKRK